MKKIIICCIMLNICNIALGQDYETYLHTAFEQLAKGNLESAKRHYSVYEKSK